MKAPTGKFLTSQAGPFMLPLMIIAIPITIIYAICLGFWVTGCLLFAGGCWIADKVQKRHHKRRTVRRTYRRYTS